MGAELGRADKAAALASYAKMADDDELEKLAVRVRARAIQRCGELLKQIEKKSGQRTDLQPSRDNPPRSPTAHAAGLSKDQQVTAVRIASILKEEFEAAIESDPPPTTTELAERETQKKPPVPCS